MPVHQGRPLEGHDPERFGLQGRLQLNHKPVTGQVHGDIVIIAVCQRSGHLTGKMPFLEATMGKTAHSFEFKSPEQIGPMLPMRLFGVICGQQPDDPALWIPPGPVRSEDSSRFKVLLESRKR